MDIVTLGSRPPYCNNCGNTAKYGFELEDGSVVKLCKACIVKMVNPKTAIESKECSEFWERYKDKGSE